MIKIEKNSDFVKVILPIETLIFDIDTFNKLEDNIFLIRIYKESTNIIRDKATINDLNMAHWLCLKNKYQAYYNDTKLQSLDVKYLIQKGII